MDLDAGLNSLLHYDIVETMPRRYFHIDSTTGAIKTVMLLDHEKIPVFNFHVKVSNVHAQNPFCIPTKQMCRIEASLRISGKERFFFCFLSDFE